jgi:hypothetical protein
MSLNPSEKADEDRDRVLRLQCLASAEVHASNPEIDNLELRLTRAKTIYDFVTTNDKE